ncbi:septal ring lytic transglycosylase RlpA family protein [Desulfococcaceae bacterium HSG9]|nr:septal ring lytic transglycosylase RlpA family protein [Desulfococcaceae bacterium HSG9]
MKKAALQISSNYIGGFIVLLVLLFLVYTGCSTKKTPSMPEHPEGYPKPYKVLGKWYQPLPHAWEFIQTGTASWYGKKFHGRKTSNGEIYNMYAVSAAHKTLPLGTYVRVTNLRNKRQLDLRINDRGPFVDGRVIDLSYKAGQKLGIIGTGTAPVKIVALGRAPSGKKMGKAAYIPENYEQGNFTIQIGAFSELQNAQRLKMKMSRVYRNAHITKYNNGRTILYRVRVGRCSTLMEARRLKKKLKRNGFNNAMIVAEEMAAISSKTFLRFEANI